MANKEPCKLGVLEAAGALQAGTLTCEALVRSCLERIELRDHQVRAFAFYDKAAALQHALRWDAKSRGVLGGIPFAVKDIIDTRRMPTGYGSPIYEGHRPASDAACVAMAQEQGAVLIGKAATSEFATQSPGPTRNPLDLDRTPGGSSSGSAAAVADFMVPVAFGTQTTGSIIRPAAYCGIVGYKPSHGLISTAGVKMLSPLHDTVGVLARSVVDAALFTFGLHGMHATHAPEAPKRLIVCESNAWDHTSPAVVNAIESAVHMLERAGVQVRKVTLSADFEEIASLQTRLVAFEAHQALSHERLCDGGRLSKRLQQRLAAGAKTHLEEYLAMRRKVDAAKANVGHLFGDADAILYPSADGEAETGLDESGSPRYGALWTLLNLPCVAFPIGMGPSGMPLGAQLIGRCYDDVKLLAATAFASRVVGSFSAASRRVHSY